MFRWLLLFALVLAPMSARAQSDSLKGFDSRPSPAAQALKAFVADWQRVLSEVKDPSIKKSLQQFDSEVRKRHGGVSRASCAKVASLAKGTSRTFGDRGVRRLLYKESDLTALDRNKRCSVIEFDLEGVGTVGLLGALDPVSNQIIALWLLDDV